MVAAMRDSSLDYRTYWLQDGQYYSRRGLGAVDCSLPPDKLAQIPDGDRQVLIDECAADPAFCARVARCMTKNPNWGHVIATSAKEAIANEMNPSAFPERAGTWPRLRARARQLVDAVSVEFAKGYVPIPMKKLSGLGGLGQWDIIASLVGTIGTAAANVYMGGVQNRAQVDLQRDQANAAIAAAQAQMNAINAAGGMNATIASANPISSVIQTVTSATVAGIPVLALAIPALGLIVWLATKK